MEDATILEVDTSAVEPVATDTNVATNAVADTNVGEPTVVEQPTPMDSNVTYDNIPKQDITIDPTKDYTQNLVENTIRLERDNNIITNSGTYVSNFLDNEYDYDQEEAGTYWVAGAINDVNTQMSFLNSLIYEEMYDEADLQRYYYDTTMATARAYAAQKERETAYGFYRAAQEKAIAEAQLTGWYMPAEGQYMLMEYETAQEKLKDTEATPEDIAKANRVIGVTEKWFGANKITTRGIKCLSMMNYEENVRHNTIMGELQKEANKIAASGAAASAASAELQLREFKFQLEEYELQSGHNITKQIGLDNKDFLGHDINEADYRNYQGLQGFSGKTTIDPTSITKIDFDPNTDGNRLFTEDDYNKNKSNWLDYWKNYYADQGKILYEATDKNGNTSWYVGKEIHQSALANMLQSSPEYYAAVLNSASKTWVDQVLENNHVDAKENYKKFTNDQSMSSFKTDISETGEITSKSAGFSDTGKKTSDGNKVVTTVVNNEVVAGYFKDGVWNPITDKNFKTSDGKSLNDFIKNMYGTDMNTQGVNAVVIDGETYSFGRAKATGTSNYTTLTEDLGYEKVWTSNLRGGKGYTGYTEEMNQKIKDSQTGDGTLDKDGNTVKNLEYMPDYMDDKNENEYTIFRATDGDTTKWYVMEDDGELREIDSAKKVARISEGGLKVGDKIDLTNDLNGDNTRERIGKLSYNVVYNKDKDESIMAYPHSDGTIEYYGNYKVLAVGLSESDVQSAGGKVLSDASDRTKAIQTSYNTATHSDKEVDISSLKKTSSSSSSSGSNKSGYDAQNTVENRTAVFNRYDVPESERADYDTVIDVKDLEEKIKNRYEDILGQGGKQ